MHITSPVGKTRIFPDVVFDLFSSCLSSVVRSSCALLERAEDPVHPNPLDYNPVEDIERKADYLFAPFSLTSCFAVVFFLFVSLNVPKWILSLLSPHSTEKKH